MKARVSLAIATTLMLAMGIATATFANEVKTNTEDSTVPTMGDGETQIDDAITPRQCFPGWC